MLFMQAFAPPANIHPYISTAAVYRYYIAKKLYAGRARFAGRPGVYG
jgi:hypothetical protein